MAGKGITGCALWPWWSHRREMPLPDTGLGQESNESFTSNKGTCKQRGMVSSYSRYLCKIYTFHGVLTLKFWILVAALE